MVGINQLLMLAYNMAMVFKFSTMKLKLEAIYMEVMNNQSIIKIEATKNKMEA